MIASNTSTHNAILGEELQLQCGFVGVPAPSVVWFHNDLLLSDRIDDNVIINNYLGDGIISIQLLIHSVESTNGGIYTCRANNTLGIDQESYSVRVVVGKTYSNHKVQYNSYSLKSDG